MFKGQKKIRILSIGTGTSGKVSTRKEDYDKFDTISMTSKFIIKFEQIAAEKILEKTLGRDGNFIRL